MAGKTPSRYLTRSAQRNGPPWLYGRDGHGNVTEGALVPISVPLHVCVYVSSTGWRSDKYNKWEINEGKTALLDLDSLAAIFADVATGNVTVEASHPRMGLTSYRIQGIPARAM